MFGSRRMVNTSGDLLRILKLPRRKGDLQHEYARLNDLLKTPEGTMILKPLQAQALYELAIQQGGFFPLRVGAGKTLVSLLAAYVLDSKRPLLLLPAALIGKTKRDRDDLSKHWRIPRNVRVFSYEMLGRVQAAKELEMYRPDLLILDEAHRAKNKKAGVTRRIVRWMKEHPETKVVILSGTIMNKSIKDFAHLLQWSHKAGAPVPLEEHVLMEWADAIDEKVNPLSRAGPGALLEFAQPEDIVEDDDLTTARRGFRRRLIETPGVVASSGDQVACSIYVEGQLFGVNSTTEENFKKLRTLWEAPDGWALSEAVDVWRVARELAIGLHYEWVPRPPDAWLNARRTWAQFVRETLKNSKVLDTELQVANACISGDLSDDEYRSWKEIQPTFTINSVPVWHDDSALKVCEDWLKTHAGICWCEHTFFAKELSRRTGFPYYGAKGLDSAGRPIEEASGPVIASVAANGTGRNLQRWNQNLITSVPGTASVWEQLLGRTHRDGQLADEVTVDVLVGCFEHLDSYEKAVAGARMAEDTLGHSQKLLIADVSMPPAGKGFRWQKNMT